MGDVRLARELWSHVDHPLHCALLASHVLRIIASRSSAARVEALAAAAEIETWAIGVMDEIHEQVPPLRLGASGAADGIPVPMASRADGIPVSMASPC